MKIFILFFCVFNVFAQNFSEPLPDAEPIAAAPATASAPLAADASLPVQEKIIYEYKKEDYFDFEALSVKGELLSPGDLSGKAAKRVKFNSKDYVRRNFDDYIEDDLMEIY